MRHQKRITLIVTLMVGGLILATYISLKMEPTVIAQSQATATPVPQATAASVELAPIPNAARGPEIPPDKGYLVQEIKDGLYWVTDGIYQSMFFTTGKGVIAVDAPETIGENYLKAIAEVTNEPVTYVIYSHAHADHIGAASIFPHQATYIAQAETAAILARANDPNRPIPVTFSDAYTLTVGSQTLLLAYKGPNHIPGNIFIYAPKQKVLMLVDVIFPGWVPFKSLALAQDVPGFIQAHDQVLSYDFDTFIGGHLTRLGARQDIETQREYILDVQANAARALETVDFQAVANQTGYENLWLLFDTYQDAVAQACAEATLAKWQGQLGGADVYTFDHCWVMQESLDID